MPGISSVLELRNHQYQPQYYHLKFSPVPVPVFNPVPVPNLVPVPLPCSNIAFLCSVLCSDYNLFLMAMLSDLYIRPSFVCYSICSNINFDYYSDCLLGLWSLLTSLQFPYIGNTLSFALFLTLHSPLFRLCSVLIKFQTCGHCRNTRTCNSRLVLHTS